MRIGAFGLAALIALGGTARAAGAEDYCNLKGFSVPLRQTIVVLDEHHVFAEDGQRDGRNDGWRRFIANLLLPESQSALERNFQPRERVTILLARKDGAGTKTVFSGCLPFYSPAERTRIETGGGYVRAFSSFIGTDEITAAKRAMDLFRIQLGNAFRSALDPAALSRSEQQDRPLSTSGLVSSLKQGGIVNFSYGLPRIVLYSDLQRFFSGLHGTIETARQAGFREGNAADLNLQNSELYVVGLSGGGLGRDALEMFLLASHAELAGSSGAAALPAFLPPPTHVARYQGQILYPDNKYVLRLRLATDQNGNAVNSWLSVQTSNEQYLPIHGVLTCGGSGCTFNGDQVFAQLWYAGRSTSRPPRLDSALPFGGARNLALHISGKHFDGSISDPLIRFEGLKSMKLEFFGTSQPSAQF
ncbi:MAG: hypothetical protein JSR60_02135 [Proteobacteria bacterium]|nr:hypothetical protein [Pseudomonadota bacterium]